VAGAPEASRESIGFIGLGALGAPMATNLIHAGFPLTLHNRSREREAVLLEGLARWFTNDQPQPWPASAPVGSAERLPPPAGLSGRGRP